MWKKLGAEWRAVAVACLFATAAQGKDDLDQPICVSSDGRFLSQPNGEPFFWLGDVAWSIFMRLTREEADEYLRDRAANGFNVIQAVAAGGPLDTPDVPNRYGELPLLERDFKRPNPKYFEHVDWVVSRARQYGIRVAMLPIWGLKQVSFDDALDIPTAETYGRWIASRYRDQGIIWVLGGDTTPLWVSRRKPGERDRLIGNMAASVRDTRPIYDAMAVGIIDGDSGNPFITYHPTNLSFSGTAQPRTSLYFHDRNWLDMNMLQSSHFIDPTAHLKVLRADFSWRAPFSYQPISDEYLSTPVRPVLDGEPRFEDLAIDLDKEASKGYWSGYDARAAAYQALFAGAAGHTYGNHSIWQFYEPGSDRPYQLPRREVSWRLAMARPSNSQMQHAKALLLSRPYFTRIPDQNILISPAEEGAAHVGATRDKHGSYVMVYLPQGQPVTLDLTKVSGPRAIAWWFDPRSGAATRLPDTFPTTSHMTFVPPSRGAEEDWILVVDDEGRNFGPPGKVARFRQPTGARCTQQLTQALTDP